jgi:hypothetical protein
MMLLKKYLFLSEFLCKIKVHDKVSGCIRFYCPDTPGNTVRIIRNTHLLLGKGQKVTASIENRLRRFGVYEQEVPDNPGSRQSVAIPSCDRQSAMLYETAEELKNRLNIRNERIFRVANDILGNIIFSSREKPWWILAGVHKDTL